MRLGRASAARTGSRFAKRLITASLWLNHRQKPVRLSPTMADAEVCQDHPSAGFRGRAHRRSHGRTDGVGDDCIDVGFEVGRAGGLKLERHASLEVANKPLTKLVELFRD